MSGYEYIRAMRSLYNPRTPRAALVAAEAGILPVEALVYKASSVKPLFEEPYDLDELERVLAQGDLAFGDAMMLSEIFASMTLESDKERALFAAESLTTLENRWARKVEDLRKLYDPLDEAGEGSLRFARVLYEQALIAGRSAPIRNYYLLQAYYILCQRPDAGSGGPGFALLVRCLVLLGLLDQAQSEVEGELGRRISLPKANASPTRRGFGLLSRCLSFLGIRATAEPEAEDPIERRSNGDTLALAVEIAYMNKDVNRIHALLKGRNISELELEGDLTAVLEAWQA